MIKTPAEISLSSTCVLHRLALLLFTYGQSYLRKWRLQSLQTHHDEIIIEAGDAIADQVQAIVKESMEETFERIIPEVPFVAEPEIADSWKSYVLLAFPRWTLSMLVG